jgi:hypothetical protein
VIIVVFFFLHMLEQSIDSLTILLKFVVIIIANDFVAKLLMFELLFSIILGDFCCK